MRHPLNLCPFVYLFIYSAFSIVKNPWPQAQENDLRISLTSVWTIDSLQTTGVDEMPLVRPQDSRQIISIVSVHMHHSSTLVQVLPFCSSF